MSAEAYIRMGCNELLPITALHTTNRQCRSVAAIGEHYFTHVVDSSLRSTGHAVCLGCGTLTVSEDSALRNAGWGRA